MFHERMLRNFAVWVSGGSSAAQSGARCRDLRPLFAAECIQAGKTYSGTRAMLFSLRRYDFRHRAGGGCTLRG
jgi:hypothetical protein